MTNNRNFHFHPFILYQTTKTTKAKKEGKKEELFRTKYQLKLSQEYIMCKEIKKSKDTWLAQQVEHGIRDCRVMSSSPMVGIEFT